MDTYTYKINSLYFSYKTSLDNMIRKVHFPGSGKKKTQTILETNSPNKTWDFCKEKQKTREPWKKTHAEADLNSGQQH